MSVFYEGKRRLGDFSDFKYLTGNKKLLFFHQIVVAQLFLMKAIIITLIWAALIQGVLLSGLYLFSKKHKSFANFLLGLFLLAIVYEGFTTFIPNESIGSYSLNYYFALPVVSYSSSSDYCVDAGIQTGLGGGTPTGGVYSGTGVTDDGNGMTYSFDPATAGVGVHTINWEKLHILLQVKDFQDDDRPYRSRPFCDEASLSCFRT